MRLKYSGFILLQKKSKMEISSSDLANVDCVVDQSVQSKTINISDSGEAVLSKDSSRKVLNDSDSNKHKKGEESDNEEQSEGNLSSGLTRARLLPGRRGRAIERRKASTKRWEERKKALLAAARKDVSDTDSITSDDTQLSPVQKARAKNNMDKELEKQKRIAKVLKNLEINLTEKYSALRDASHIDTDSDTRRTRLNKDLHSNTMRENKKELSQKQQTEKQSDTKRNRSSSQEKSMGKENSSLTPKANKATTDNVAKTESRSNDEICIPLSMKAELLIGDTKYIVTSLLAGSQFDKGSLNNLTRCCNVDESSQEKNTDIIDAVQLRRIRPIASNSNTKQFIERCLNIEVEGTELEALRRVQIELVDFVENEMKNKLFGTNCDAARTDKGNACTKHYQKLDQQLKNMIERAIINNIEITLMRDAADMSSKASSQHSTRLSPSFVKAAVNSPKYQPKVMLKRLDLIKLNKLYNIDIKTLKQLVPKNKLAGPFSAISRKRQSVLPIRYNDYNTSALDSDSNESDDAIIQETPRPMNAPNVRTYRNLKHSAGTNIAIIKRMDGSIIKPAVNSVTSSLPSAGQNSVVAAAVNEEKPDYEDVIKIEGAIAENHICGVCGLTFSSRKDVEAHVRTHKVTSTENNATAPQQNQKQKMMRCRRCQEIVEARYVKAHTCKNVMNTHKCYVCNSTFRTEKLLVRHLDNHDQSEFNIEKITNVDSKKQNNNDISKAATSILIVSTKPEKEQKIDASDNTQTILTEKNDVQSDKIANVGEKLNGANAVEKPQKTYTCFVCDKIFTDEEILKDHLQKHCDDLSEGEQNNSKEQYQCAICGDSLESDQALEEHVGKHLFDDEDDNPNLISIGDQENKKSKSETYHCSQCPKMFDSDILLEMHMQAHEEEAAIAEWEKKGINISPYQCMLCEQSEFLDTEEELAIHLNIIHNIHTGDAEVCQLCDRSFRTLEELQEHVATH